MRSHHPAQQRYRGHWARDSGDLAKYHLEGVAGKHVNAALGTVQLFINGTVGFIG